MSEKCLAVSGMEANMSGEYHARVIYTEPILRQAVRAFIWRRVIRRRWWLWLGAVTLVIFGLARGWSAEPSLIDGIAVAALISAPLFLIAVWRAHFRNTVGGFRKMTSPEVAITFRDADVTVVSALGTAVLPWSRFVEVWRLPKFWMLFLEPNQFITLPLDTLPPEILNFIRSKLRTKR
jgi:hypothetical protein